MSAGGQRKTNKGSSTIETALIISAILLILATLVYSSLIMYQKLLLTKTAEYIAQQGAVIWTGSKKNIYDGSTIGTRNEMSMAELYYQIIDDSMFTGKKVSEKIDISLSPPNNTASDNLNLQDEKFLKMKKAIWVELSRGLLKPSSTHLEINYSNIFIQRKIDIALIQEIKLPFGGIKEFFKGKDSITLTGKGTAIIIEPEEYIRSSDFIVEYITKTGVMSNIGKKISDLKDKLTDENK